MKTLIGIIVVLYYSKEQNYHAFVGHSNVNVILVDNTPKRDLCITGENVHYVPLKENRGIAIAQNIGIKKARELNCASVVFFDQDSVIAPDYVEEMRVEFERLKEFYPMLAVLGPTVINRECRWQYKTIDGVVSEGCKIVPALISSGSFCEMDILDKVGMMEERLFIDYVDFEWCWRARREGYVCAITQNVTLVHKVGQGDRTFMGYPIIISNPVRYYYQYRNFLWLLRRRYVPLKWRRNTAIRKLVEIFLLPFYSENRRVVMKNIFRGIKDGIFCSNDVK